MRSPAIVVLLSAACSYPPPDDVLPLQLVAIEPSFANVGDTITLEGTFANTALDTVMVNFPGGAAQPASILGLHRARVVVPAAAAGNAGDLYVTRGNERTDAVAFRHAAFVPELQAFSELPVHLLGEYTFRTSAVVENYLYVLGGEKHDSDGNAYGWTGSVEQAPIAPNGSLGSFASRADVALVTPRAAHASVVIGPWLYVLGGTAGVPLSSVERAPIASDGSLGRFAIVPGGDLEVARARHAAVVLGNSLYVLGGTAASVERATIYPDGSLERFATVSGVSVISANKTRRLGSVTAVVGDWLYVVGGFDDQSLASVDRAPIFPDGSLGPVVTTSIALATSRADGGGVVIGRWLYMLGGITLGPTSFLWLDKTELAPIDSGGLFGKFMELPSLALRTPRRGAATAVVGDYVYVLGGDRSHVALNSVEAAAIH